MSGDTTTLDAKLKFTEEEIMEAKRISARVKVVSEFIERTRGPFARSYLPPGRKYAPRRPY